MPLPPPPKKPASKVAEAAIVKTASAKTAMQRKRAATHVSSAPIANVPVASVPTPSAVSATPAPAPQAASTVKSTTKNTNSSKKPVSKKALTRPTNQATKLFVLDTNVLMHDPSCLFRFEEHDVYLALVVLEEMDNHKKGANEVARNVRQCSRSLNALVATAVQQDFNQGIALNSLGHQDATGKLFFQTEKTQYTLPSNALPQGKADNQILGVVAALKQEHPKREVVLVSKDINMRIKARALGLLAEDYENDKALNDDDVLYSGALELPADFWHQQSKMQSWKEGAFTFYRVHGILAQQMLLNQFVFFEQAGENSLYARVVEVDEKSAVLKTLRDCTHPKQAAWGVTARNREQNFAMNLLLDPEIDLVTLAGNAGTGKTLLALACGLTQVLDERRYTEIIMTRATVSVGEDIGFLPGTEEEKMSPWMGALDDNLEFLTKNDSQTGDWGRAATNDLVRSRIKIKSMNFMRGRTFVNKFVIIDEAQNLTPKQMKTLITRAGPGTKMVCMGNLAQIDTPYLTEGSSGLTAVVDKVKGWAHSGHITLARGERSRLADFAADVL